MIPETIHHWPEKSTENEINGVCLSAEYLHICHLLMHKLSGRPPKSYNFIDPASQHCCLAIIKRPLYLNALKAEKLNLKTTIHDFGTESGLVISSTKPDLLNYLIINQDSQWLVARPLHSAGFTEMSHLITYRQLNPAHTSFGQMYREWDHLILQYMNTHQLDSYQDLLNHLTSYYETR